MRRFVPLLGLFMFLPCTQGCASAVQAGHSTALDSVNLVEMTDDMARRIVGSPQVQEAIQRDGKLRVVVQPVENNMTAEVLPRGAGEAFTGRVRALLSEAAPEQFTWIMNRDDFRKLRQREIDFDLGPSPDAIQPEYALVARFSSVANESIKHRSSYYLCVYELTNIQDRQLLWTGRYEVKKTAVKGFLD